jgi:hypothetical protein
VCAKTWNVVGNFLAREQELMLCYAMFEQCLNAFIWVIPYCQIV